MVHGELETEVKIRLSDRQPVMKRLESEGFAVSTAKVFEANDLYDHSEGPSLKSAGMLLRLRQAGEKSVITWKGPARSGPHKSRPELETTLGDLAPMEKILGHIGFKRTFRYEKYRTEYSKTGGPGVVTVDETPLGDFLEIEGPAEWIDQVAAVLGFSKADYILDSYGALYQSYCAEKGITPTDMVFAS